MNRLVLLLLVLLTLMVSPGRLMAQGTDIETHSVDEAASRSVNIGVSAWANRLQTVDFWIEAMRPIGKSRPIRNGSSWGGQHGLALGAYRFGARDEPFDVALAYRIGIVRSLASGFFGSFTASAGPVLGREEVTSFESGCGFSTSTVSALGAYFGTDLRLGYAGRGPATRQVSAWVGLRAALDFYNVSGVAGSGHAHAGPEVGASLGLMRGSGR